MKGRGLLSIADLTAEDIWGLLNHAQELKGAWSQQLQGKVVALLFEKPSLRTRVSFEVAMRQLGGHSLFLSPAEVGLGRREPAAHVAQVLSRYVDGLVVRTFAQSLLHELAEHASIPVINGLSDHEHPCQALADLLTIQQSKGKLSGLTLAFIGDANNVARSLLLAAALVGMHFHLATPPAYGMDGETVERARSTAAASGSRLLFCQDPQEAVAGADVVYTDVWVSMGQEAEAAQRRREFSAYRVDRKLLSAAAPEALLMHPLPAHPGEEVAPGLLDGPPSVVFDQAENRLHLQKAVLSRLLGNAHGGTQG
ncbi:MAG: ornithine carbamoyltransferase [Dehalococcoidia bacterium]